MPGAVTPAIAVKRPRHKHEPAQHRKKIGIVGAGRVGSTIAYAALIRRVAKQISLYDPTRSRVTAEVLDLSHGLMFVPMAGVEGSNDVEILAGSDVIVFTAREQPKSPARHAWTLPKRTLQSVWSSCRKDPGLSRHMRSS